MVEPEPTVAPTACRHCGDTGRVRVPAVSDYDDHSARPRVGGDWDGCPKGCEGSSYRVIDGHLAGEIVPQSDTTECHCAGLDPSHRICLGVGRVLGWVDTGSRPTGRLEPVT